MNSILASVQPSAATATGHSTLRETLEAWAHRKIRGFEGTVDAEGEYLSKIYPTAKSVSEQIAADYHGRFLIELIQNAHDVHPASGKDGEIEVVFDAGAGEHGVLYVANGGAPFGKPNVEALCDLGLSSKDPGQAIGNKGLGFRSVRHVCDAPEIYSQAQGLKGADRFEGFCFRFAHDRDLAALMSTPRLLELAQRDLPPFHVPIWLVEQSPKVRTFASRGFATVIVLPLRDAAAAKIVSQEIETLRGLKVPMLLFLSRLQRLEVRTIAADGLEGEPLRLTRFEDSLPGAPDGVTVADLGLAGRYLIARRDIAESDMLEAITAGIDAKQLHSHWSDWKGEGEVALAVRLDTAAPPISRLFTYLPMGEQALAPFAGYLHASFFPTANRKGLDGKVRLNAMLLEAAADLAAATVGWLAGTPTAATEALNIEDRARAVVDLTCWRRTESFETTESLPTRVTNAVATVMGVEAFADAPVAPVLAPGDAGDLRVAWRTPRAARRWNTTAKTFSASSAAQHGSAVGVWPLWPGLGDRVDALVDCFRARVPSYFEGPAPAERAALAVKVAESLHAARVRAPTWSGYYIDLAEFVASGGVALANQRILLGENGDLYPAMSTAVAPDDPAHRGRRRTRRTGQVAIFAPPARRGAAEDEAGDLSPPRALADNFAFLSDKLDWYGELADARAFLIKHKLIQEFDRESILTQLARVLREDTRNASRAAGLRWAFQIWRRPKGGGRSVSLPANLQLYVPTVSQDFIPADQAIFSDGWPDETRGRLVERLLKAAPSGCSDLEEVAARRLARPDHYAFRVGTLALWTEFLTELRVQRGLHPIRKPVTGSHAGRRIGSPEFWVALGLTVDAHDAWGDEVLADKPASLSPGSFYTISGDLMWMPGQWDVPRFDRDALECFALLTIAWLGEVLPETWSLTIRHSHFNQADVREWPTPLKTFLQRAAWIPAQEPTPSGAQHVVVAPSEIWMTGDAGERFPPFLRRPALPVMRALERASGSHITAIRAHTGLRTLDAANSLLAQAGFLADQFAKPGFDGFYERHMANLYAGTWQRLAEKYRATPLPDPAAAPTRLLARRGGSLEVFTLLGTGATAEPIYVRDAEDDTAASLVEAAGRPMLEIRAGDRARLGEVLRALYGDRVRLLSEADYQITLDGREVGTGEMVSVLDWCPRLPLMVAVAMEGLKGLDARNLPVNRQVLLERLTHMQVQGGVRLGFRLDDLAQDDLEGGPDALNITLPDGRPVIVIRSAGPAEWSHLDQSLSALCDALGQPSLEQVLRILLRSLDSNGALLEEAAAEGDVDSLCTSLRLTPRARRAVRETLGEGLERHVRWLRALLHMAGGQAATDAFALQEAEAVKDPARLREALSPWLEPLGCDAQSVLDACRTALTIAEVRDALNLDFEALNFALVAVGQPADTYPDIHARQLSNRVKTSSFEICEALRAVFAPTLEAHRVAPAYAVAREAAAALAPDPAWTMRWREVPEDILTAHINAWLASYGAGPLGSAHPGLEPVEGVRRENSQTLKVVTALAAPLVRAWCGARNKVIPPPWAAPDGGFADLRARLDEAGVIDFRPLDREALLAWLERLRIWPQGMALTLERETLELGDDAVAAARARAEAEQAERRRQERSIEFNGRARDPEETDWTALDAELGETLSKALLRTPLGQAAALAAAQRRPSGAHRGSGGQGGGFGGGGGRIFAPSAKTDMIGRLGELAVRRWLQARSPKQDIDAGWVSGNGEFFTGRKGNDGLGYDFEIAWQRQTWQIEVKASLNDPQAFQLGETEVRAGRAAARARSGVQYWIAYVSNLSNPAQARVELIPNPLSEAGEAVLELLGEGLRYSFRRL